MDVAAWLVSLGLGEYEQVFRNNHVDAGLLARLTAEDLKEIGVASVGHRRRLLDAIAALGEAAPPVEAAIAERPAQTTADRRQLTVMFVDLAGSTELSQRLDPEEVQGLIQVYQELVRTEVNRLAGHVAKYMGDGVLAYFGWPQAHEDAAERAVRAGLAITASVANIRTGQQSLSARVGIATGLVVVGDLIGSDEARERAVVGETPNLAARLQDVAQPGDVVIAESTRTILGDLFIYDNLGPTQLKGFARPMRVHRVTGDTELANRFQARHAQGVTALVGREPELTLLRGRWDQARDGEGQVVLLSGEPGIGKSRLVLALTEQIAAEPHGSLRYQCSPHHTNSALWPIIDQLQRAAGLARADTPEIKHAKLETRLGIDADDLAGMVPIFAELLGLPAVSRFPLPDLSPEQKKARLFQTLLAQIEQAARERPLLIVLEDAHWIDPTTLEWLDLVVEQLQKHAVLLVVTCRPGFTSSWTGRAHVSLLTLGNLGRKHAAALIEHIATGKGLPAEVAEQIITRTDGVPLFVEELTKTVLESGMLGGTGHGPTSGLLSALAIPSTLHDSLLARLDRLAPIKEVAQIGALIGREFSYELLAAVAGRTPDALRQALAELARAELIFTQGQPPSARYTFKHALVQDAAYRSLLRSRRRQLHGQLALVLEERFADVAATQPELLAHHWAEAGMVEKAINYRQNAGEQAIARSAGAEATAQLTQALALLDKLPEDRQRQQRELDLQVALGSVVAIMKGYGSTEAERVSRRARELCDLLQDTEQLPHVLLAQSAVQTIRGRYAQSRDVGKELLRWGEMRGDARMQSIGHQIIGVASFHLGDLVYSRMQFDAILDLYEHSLSSTFGFFADARAVSLCHLSLLHFICGEPEQARMRNCQALARAEELSHPGSIADTHSYCFMLAQLSGDLETALDQAQAYVVISRKQGFTMLLSEALMFQGWALTHMDHAAAGICQMRGGLAVWLHTKSKIAISYLRGLLIDAYQQGGWPQAEQLRQLNKAILEADRYHEHWYKAELLRRRGLLLASGVEADPSAGSADIRQAIELARAQGAKLWELRAVCSLHRIASTAEERTGARGLLRPLYASFTEGLETLDLQEARTLLDS
jgi:predicted ATPase/class 3 adenylate cyclase